MATDFRRWSDPIAEGRDWWLAQLPAVIDQRECTCPLENGPF